MITELALVMQILITAIYWPVLHQHMLKMTAHLNDPVLHHILVHIHWFPLFGIALCVALSKNVFIHKHASYFIKFGAAYLPINAFGTW